MDDSRTRRRNRDASAYPIHLGPEGPPAVPQRWRRLQARQTGPGGSRDGRGLENDPSDPAALAANPAKDRKHSPLPNNRILRVAMPGRYRSSSATDTNRQCDERPRARRPYGSSTGATGSAPRPEADSPHGPRPRSSSVGEDRGDRRRRAAAATRLRRNGPS